MEERSLYDRIGMWLTNTKDDQEKSPFIGYVTDPTITHSGSKNVRKPDVVGVQYERSGTAAAKFEFHYHLVEVKAGTNPNQLQNLVGEIELLKRYVNNGNVAADSVQYYIALPTPEVPVEIRDWAVESDIGIISVITGEQGEPVIKEEPTAKEIDNYCGDVLSGADKGSVGNFKSAVEDTAILKQVMNPEEFFRDVIQPEQKEYQNRLNRKNAIQYVNNDSARKALKQLLCFIETETSNTVSVHNGNSGFAFFVESTDGERELKVVPKQENFKVYLERQEELLFRIAGPNTFEITDEEISNFEEFTGYLEHYF
jgi:hypothetical protein